MQPTTSSIADIVMKLLLILAIIGFIIGLCGFAFSCPVPQSAALKAQISGPNEGSVGETIAFQSSGSSGRNYRWTVTPRTRAVTTDSGRTLRITPAAPGRYRIGLCVTKWRRSDCAYHDITVQESDPDPEPDIEPVPIPEDVNAELLFYIESLDTDTIPEEQLYMLTSLVFRDAIAEAGCVLLGRFDDDSLSDPPPAWLSPWLDVIGESPPPVFAFRKSDDPDVITAVPFPLTQEEFWSVLEGDNDE